MAKPSLAGGFSDTNTESIGFRATALGAIRVKPTCAACVVCLAVYRQGLTNAHQERVVR